MEIRQASSEAEIEMARILFQEYAAWLRVDLCFQKFPEELANLPGLYAPPRGRLLIAWSDEQAAGCVALRPVKDSVCEMKRLFVRPAFRGRSVGRKLSEQIVASAQELEYSSMVLDTLPSMEPALCLYDSLGFVRCAPYYETPLKDTVFMELKLGKRRKL
jgi:ribosomal protein S18 acetylase RimI-like enzyme